MCYLRTTRPNDVDTILDVLRAAFGQEEEAELVAQLLEDPTAEPVVSLLALEGKKPVGHVLFSRVYFAEQPNSPLMHILAPLAVVPDSQRRGIGGKLIQEGLAQLTNMGSHLVFVLGHPEYYPKYGFIPDAAQQGFQPPYPIPQEHAAAWMVQALGEEQTKYPPCTIRCARTLDQEKYWRE